MADTTAVDFLTECQQFASTGSSDSSVPAHVSQRPTFNYRRYSQQSYDSNASSILPMDSMQGLNLLARDSFLFSHYYSA